MGGQRFAANQAEVFEAADPARTMPKWLVLGAIGAVIVLVILMSWLNSRSLEQPDAASTNAPATEATAPAQTPQPAVPAQAAQGQVVLTAIDAVWLQVSDKGGASLYSGMLQPGQTFAVPATAAAPVLKTGKPEALRINVGNAIAPAVGPPATTVSNVSLLPADLLKPGPPAPAVVAPATAQAPAPKPRPGGRRPAAAAPAPPPEAAPPTTNTGE
jgi:hypothetical protein